MKRILDVILVMVGLLCLGPIILGTACLIRAKLGSPVLFTQERPGLQAKPFVLYKFRTMRDERDKSGNLLPDHLRLTLLGKWIRKLSLDELPQLYNVLKGDMSLVGPRPLLMEYVPLYTERQAMRHRVRPGITGLAQVSGRNAVSWEEKFEYDVQYVENQNLLLDLKIMFLTVVKVVKSEGINQGGHATVEKFRGSRSSVSGERF